MAEVELIHGEDREAAWEKFDATGEHRWSKYLADADSWKDGTRSIDPNATEELDLRELRALLLKKKAVAVTIPGGFT